MKLRILSEPTLRLAFLAFLAPLAPVDAAETSARADERALQCELLIVGGTESGCAAAVQAARMGVESIVLVNDIDWLGGQFSAEGLGAIDEDRGVKNRVPFARSGLFADLTRRIEESNQAKYGHARPGNAWTAHTTVRPAEAAALFAEMVQPYVDSGQLRIVRHYYPIAAEMSNDGQVLKGLRFRSTQDNRPELAVEAKLTIDASDWGDAIQLAGAAYEFGPDLRDKYGEPGAPQSRAEYPLTDMNPISYCLVIEETDEYQPIPQPEHYDDRQYYLTTSVTKKDYEALGWPRPPHRPFNPPWKSDTHVFYQGEQTVYSQRRLVDRYGHRLLDPKQRDVLLLCWTLQDYPLDVLPQHVADALEAHSPGSSRKNIVEMTRDQRQIVFEDAKQYSLGMLYHLQTTVHDRMKDPTHSFRRFTLSEEFGTPDRLPPKPYVRESLRLKAMYMMREQDTRNWKGRQGADRFAKVMYYDGVACWQFVYDFHPTGRMFLPDEGRSGPWEPYIKPLRSWTTTSDRSLLALRSLVPERVDGLLGAQKNLGYSSIVSSAFRLHGHGLAVGQASGATAAVCLKRDLPPRAVPYDAAALAEVRAGLCAALDGGTPAMLWPFADLAPDHPAFIAANQLAARQSLPLARTDVDFKADAPAEPAWREEVVRLSLLTKQADSPPAPPQGPLTRGEFVRQWWAAIEKLPERPFPAASSPDADGDGLANADDAAPLDGDNDNRMDHLDQPQSP